MAGERVCVQPFGCPCESIVVLRDYCALVDVRILKDSDDGGGCRRGGVHRRRRRISTLIDRSLNETDR